MIIQKSTGQVFKDRKEAKRVLGVTYYKKLEKEKIDLIFIDNNQLATSDETIYKTSEKIS